MTVYSPYWTGQAPAVAQVTTIQVTAYAAGTTYTITVGGVLISVIGQGTINATAAALAAAWNASTHPYCTGVTATVPGGTLAPVTPPPGCAPAPHKYRPSIGVRYCDHPGTGRIKKSCSNYASFSRKGTTLYMHVHYWPGETVAMGGLMSQVKSARLLASGKDVKFEQDKFRVRFTGLPEKAPDDPVTTIAIECDGEPRQDNIFVRKERPRLKA